MKRTIILAFSVIVSLQFGEFMLDFFGHVVYVAF